MGLMDLMKLAGDGGLDFGAMGTRMVAAHELAAENVALTREMVILLREQNSLLREIHACLTAPAEP